jgi:aspartate kinase
MTHRPRTAVGFLFVILSYVVTAMMVMKFGGTSVENAGAIDRVASIVRNRREHRPIVVVSAMAGVTDELLEMARLACCGDLPGALERCDALKERHFRAVSELVPKDKNAAMLADLQKQFTILTEVAKGIAAVGECSPRTKDYVASFGELCSSAIVVGAFISRGIHAVWVDPRQCLVTNAEHTCAAPMFAETNARMAEQIRPLVEKDKVPVIGGFVGATSAGTTTTIGRGGSDYSAAIVGAALGAKRIEIWTDVEGMLTTDPRICSNAQPIRTISFDEAAEMAYFGAKVLHPATLLPAIQKNIPVYVLNSRNPQSKGTCIRARAPRSRTLFRAIAAKKGVSIISVYAPRTLVAHDFLNSLFDVLHRHRMPIDIVSTSEVSVSLTVDSSRDMEALVSELRGVGEVVSEEKQAIVCLVGSDIHGRVGVAGQVFTAVAAAGVSVRMISQGASEINISFVIREDALATVVRHLHAKFFEDGSAVLEKSAAASAAAKAGSRVFTNRARAQVRPRVN